MGPVARASQAHRGGAGPAPGPPVIVAAALCPHPPLLYREVGGLTDAVPELRSACHDALAALLAFEPEAVVVVGGDLHARTWDPTLPPDVDRYVSASGGEEHGGARLPLSLGIGGRLLAEAGWTGPTLPVSVTWDPRESDLAALAEALLEGAETVVLLVLGDGTARRTERAPGHLDERAAPFDARVAAALAAGDCQALRLLDLDLAEDLIVAGRSAYRFLGEVGIRTGVRESRLLYDAAPLGVGYHVAQWVLGDGGEETVEPLSELDDQD